MKKYIPITKDNIPSVDTLIAVSNENDINTIIERNFASSVPIRYGQFLIVSYSFGHSQKYSDSVAIWKFGWLIEEVEEEKEKEQLWWVEGIGKYVYPLQFGKKSNIINSTFVLKIQPATGDLQKGPDHTKWEKV